MCNEVLGFSSDLLLWNLLGRLLVQVHRAARAKLLRAMHGLKRETKRKGRKLHEGFLAEKKPLDDRQEIGCRTDPPIRKISMTKVTCGSVEILTLISEDENCEGRLRMNALS